MRVILALALLAFAGVARADIWTSCGSATDDFQVANVRITPDPPKIGQAVNVSVSGTLKTAVTSGSVDVTIKYGSITLIHQTLDLCEVVDKTAYRCPFAAGPLTISLSQTIPSIAPPGDYTGHITISDQNSHEVACVNLKLTMTSSSLSTFGRFNKMAAAEMAKQQLLKK